MSNMQPLRHRIARMLAKGMETHAIAKALGCSPQYVRETRLWVEDPERIGARRREWDRRRNGRMPRKDFIAERRRAMKERAAKVKRLLDQGLSFTQAAERLGWTPGTVAGLAFRIRQMNKEAA